MASQTHDPFRIRQEDQETAVRLAKTMKYSLKGRPVQAPIFEGKEPPQFVAVFQHMVVLKNDRVHQTESVALIQVSGTGVHNSKALQVEAYLKKMPGCLDLLFSCKRGNIELILLVCTSKKQAGVGTLTLLKTGVPAIANR
ncbi:unnamed protein product [Arabidopsis lyrata]|nr:unnamed protein product [Arabidopsis lyrata]